MSHAFEIEAFRKYRQPWHFLKFQTELCDDLINCSGRWLSFQWNQQIQVKIELLLSHNTERFKPNRNQTFILWNWIYIESLHCSYIENYPFCVTISSKNMNLLCNESNTTNDCFLCHVSCWQYVRSFARNVFINCVY